MRLQQKERAPEYLRRSKRQLEQQIAARLAAERKLLQSEESLRALSGRLLAIQDEERRHLGRELHDSVGQYLVAVKMQLDSLKRDAAAMGVHVVQRISSCATLVEQSIKDLRTTSYLLYPPLLEETGLGIAIVCYLDGFMKRSGIHVTSEIPQESRRLPPDVELSLFRVLQESLTNVHRHSGSATAHVSVSIEAEQATVSIQDKGKGIDPLVVQAMKNSVPTLGVGLRGMTERMRQLGGNLEICSTDQGTTVTARCPAPSSTGIRCNSNGT
jgi:signal transduction histidine kinase